MGPILAGVEYPDEADDPLTVVVPVILESLLGYVLFGDHTDELPVNLETLPELKISLKSLSLLGEVDAA
eukprot:CAMPEP_0184314206 /NCGR_PEP_ID=MMETSP1049-20130417/72374_1 /TAXON_ID=77928 /ORGANISM="Proteomonas sulcata, Strain CCMP704" /LENGTH=68 /DNA_ID=CAMNT_0026632007 /DNA_START=975 /DNA_END=1181 /DNA_ORIENTATION=+